MAIASRMVASKATSPDVLSVIEVDMENVAAAREPGLTYLPFVARATLDALRAYPDLNASIDLDSGTMRRHPAVHLAIAVDTDRGLHAPVIFDAGELSVRGLATRIKDLATRARAGKLESRDLSGSTFTITNPGTFGSLITAPIINQPNVAILSVDAVLIASSPSTG